MKQSESVKCSIIFGFLLGEREVSLVWVDNGNLGIVVKQGDSLSLVAIERELDQVAVSRSPELVAKAMALMALCDPPSKEAFSACFEAANVMVYWDTEVERMNMLTRLVGRDTAKLVMTDGWAKATELANHVFSKTDHEKFDYACRLFFTEPTSQTRQ